MLLLALAVRVLHAGAASFHDGGVGILQPCLRNKRLLETVAQDCRTIAGVETEVPARSNRGDQVALLL
jgi:hypothetical protein